MNWINQYQLFLFDFDGLLVNTEHLHYMAYKRLCANRGYVLTWDFKRYTEAAHHEATGLRDQIYLEFPALKAEEPDWKVLYDEKKQAFLQLLEEGNAELMPGIASLLEALQQADICRCVVTHSPLAVISLLREQHPLLNSIPYWITRENYSQPKPNPECYHYAISQFAKPNDRIIGFEDTPRGFTALQQTRAHPVLICPNDLPYVEDLVKAGKCHYTSFLAIDPIKGP